MVEIVKQPIDLQDSELKKLFVSIIDFKFDDWIINELEIKKSEIDDTESIIDINCHNTGYSLMIYNNYKIDIESFDSNYNITNIIDVFNCLLEIGAIKIKN
jgi:hypothetical protein